MYIGAATMENSMEIPQKIKKRTTIFHSILLHITIPLLSIYLKKTKTLIRKDMCIPMFITALFILSNNMEVTQMSLNR